MSEKKVKDVTKLKSGLLLQICNDPAEFFSVLRDDMMLICDDILPEHPDLNEAMQYSILQYFEQAFNV